MLTYLTLFNHLLRATLYRRSDQCLAQAGFEPYSAHVPLEDFPPYDANTAIVYRYRQQASVNLGSWMVNEAWMVPSIFRCGSGARDAEFDIASGWGGLANARSVLERHWDEWLTESDFEYLAGLGIDTVRMPIGYWSMGPAFCKNTLFESVAEVYTNSWSRVVRAINWAAKYEIGVLVDLHGAPGSQNGHSHSGTSDGIQGLFGSEANMSLTIEILVELVHRLGNVTNIVGIQLLNEPAAHEQLEAFYDKALARLRGISDTAAAFPFYLHDAYDLERVSKYAEGRNDFVVVDHHSYFVFGDEESRHIPATLISKSITSGAVAADIARAANRLKGNLVVDEFSCALSQESLGNDEAALEAQRSFCSSQVVSYANITAGWSFWSYKTENCESDRNWCFRNAVATALPASFDAYPYLQAGVKPLFLGQTAAGDLHVGLGRRHARGAYEFGRATAFDFAMVLRSRLGFKQQFFRDHCAPHLTYDSWAETEFIEGLADAEVEVLEWIL